jgi:hypothetical protein
MTGWRGRRKPLEQCGAGFVLAGGVLLRGGLIRVRIISRTVALAAEAWIPAGLY